MNLTLGSVCSGIGGAELAFEGLAEHGFMCEIEEFPRRVLAHRFPTVPLYRDMLELVADPLPCDILVGGTPCQAFSIAGKRLSLEDARGNLALAFCLLMDGIDEANAMLDLPPAVCLWENVPGVLTTHDNAFGCFLAALVGHDRPLINPGRRKGWPRAGMVAGPRRVAAWRILDAQHVGLAQRRKRVFVVASARPGFDPSAVLLEQQGVFGDSPSRQEERQDVAAPLAASTGGSGGRWTSAEQADNLIAYDKAPSITASGRGFARAGEPKGGDCLVAYGGNRTSGPLDVATARNAGKSPHGRLDFETETFVVQAVTGEIAHCLGTANNGKGSSEDGTGRGVPTIAFDAKAGGNTSFSVGDLPGNLRGAGHGGGHAAIASGDMKVRRLTPTECEVLQGLPKEWTNVPKSNKNCAPDGSRYRAIGNGFAVNVVRWIARRLVAEMTRC